MTMLGLTNVKIERAVLTWDGLRNPETRQSGSTNYNVQFIVAKNDPVIQELTNICTNALNESEFRGTMPPNGNWPG